MTADDVLGFLAVDPDAVEAVALLHLLDDPLAVAGNLVHLDDGVEAPVGDEELVGVDDE